MVPHTFFAAAGLAALLMGVQSAGLPGEVRMWTPVIICVDGFICGGACGGVAAAVVAATIAYPAVDTKAAARWGLWRVDG